jgi:bis(5'-nucleosyl)-tetraphosphatase (symmetrical)
MVHAGLLPQWSVKKACSLAAETEKADRKAIVNFSRTYGSKPDRWRDSLQGWDRLRASSSMR